MICWRIKVDKLVSIVLPTYNGAKYIRSQVDSLLKQSYSNFELIIIDDCSTDRTEDIVREYISGEPKIRCYSNRNNMGINKNFEKGIKLTEGEIIFLCDQDDIWDEHKIEKMIYKINQGYDLVYSDLRTINSQDVITALSFHKIIGTDRLYSKSLSKYLLFRNATNGCSICFRKDIVDKIIPFPNFMIYDWWIMLIASLNYKVGYINEPLMAYRLHDNNAVGLPTLEKTNEEKLEGIQQEINRLNNLQPYIMDNLEEKLKILSRYYCNRSGLYKKEITYFQYINSVVNTIFYFPRLYKNIIKNFLGDTMPELHNTITRIWLKSKFKPMDNIK